MFSSPILLDEFTALPLVHVPYRPVALLPLSPPLLYRHRRTYFDQAMAVWIVTCSRRAGAAVFSAGASHQLRDSTRRGLWLYPPRGPKTPPVMYPVYLLAQAALPLTITFALGWQPNGSACVEGKLESRLKMRSLCESIFFPVVTVW